MGRRIIAWALLVGFILLIINLSYFQWQSTYFVAVYMGIVIFYIISPAKNKFRKANNEDNKNNNTDANMENDGNGKILENSKINENSEIHQNSEK